MRRRAVIAVLLGLLAVGCTHAPDPSRPRPDADAAPKGSTPVLEGSPTRPAPTAGTPSTAARAHAVSIPALVEKQYDGRQLRLGRVLFRTDSYTQRAVTYRGDGLTISGILDLPHGNGPFPVLVLAHGYIDPATYETGQGLRREQDWLARDGYAVLHVDYRNHAGSDRDPRADERLRLGYAVDVINAVKAVRRSRIPRLDPGRIGLLGRSMGGGVVYTVLVVEPGLVDAAVVYAPVSSRAEDNFNRWIRHDPGRSELSRRIIRAYGAPARNRRFWREASPRSYFDRITEPLIIHHGTADESCPIRWSRESTRALENAGVDVSMFTYPGEPHAFVAAWPASMRRTVRFFGKHLG